MDQATSSRFGSVELAAHNLQVAYDSSVALRLPSLTVTGSVIAVIGHNGAGKSTFIKALLKLVPVLSGSLEATALSPPDRQRLRPERDMAFCPEMGSVFADISVESYIALWCRLKKGDGRYYRRSGSRYIERLSIAPLLSKLGRELSKGQRRRVQTAIGFLIEPRLFLFDEPFDGLDVQRTDELATLIAAESRERAFLISSHRMDVVEQLADVLIVLQEGACVAAGSVGAVCARLSGRSAIIAAGANSSQVITLLQAHFPDAFVGRIGDHIALTGPTVDQAALTTCLRTIGAHPPSFDLVTPRLVDAMNYHLMSLRSRSSETATTAAE